MGKDHGGFLTPKAIANRIKAKGLQKLRWYCQMCQKQCRDENGFKCHCASESHQRQMALFSSRARTFLDTFSQQFKDDFLNQLRHRHGTSRVHANLVYNDFIRDRHHVHMNATQWTSLTEFVKYLGKEGICQVEDTPKGWYLTYIDRDPKVIARQEALERRKQSELDDAERERRRIAKQIAKAREAEGGELGGGGGEGAEDGGEEENGMGMEPPEGKIAFTLAPSSTSTTSTGSSAVNGDEKEDRKKEDEEQEGKKRKREKNKDEEGADVKKKERRDDEERDKHTKRRRSSDREDERDSRSSHSRSRSPSRERSSRWDSRNKHDPSSSSSSTSSTSTSTSTSKDTQRRPLTALEEIKQREERKKQLQQRQLELKQQKQKEQQEQKKQQQQTTPDYWLVPGLIVKVKHKTLEGGRYYNKKGAVLSVEAKYLATIEMLDSGDVLKLDQNFLETVIPAVGGRVKVVNGKHRGKTAVLQAIDVDRFCATIALLPDREEDREEKVVVEGVEYEHICKVK